MYSANNQWVRLLAVLILGTVLAACVGNSSREDRPVLRTPMAQAPVSEANQNNGAAATTVNVVATDFKLSLDTPTADAGTVTFVVMNNGSVPHDFAITVAGHQHTTSLLQPGASESLTVELQPGIYDYICSVPGHDMLGMQGVFTVT